jgi:hypothetical protein
MPKKTFDELRERLLVAGVAPRHVRRYLSELSDHFEDLTAEAEPEGRSKPDAESEAISRLGNTDQLAEAMLGQPRFKSWCAQIPWAMFGIAPLLLLGSAYFLACLYLWWGWTFFKPGADTPFGSPAGPMYGLANLYFQAGKFFYISAPILAGWTIAFVAARQRLKSRWPTLALVLIAWMGATAQIQASRSVVPRGLGHISMTFFVLGSSRQTISSSSLSALVILSLTILPYFVWRLRRVVSASHL